MTSTLHKIQQCCTVTLNASPVVLLTLIFVWAFWAYNFRLCWYLIENGSIAQGSLYILFFQPFFILAIWCFIKATKTSPGTTLDVLKKHEILTDIENGYQDSEYVQLLQNTNNTFPSNNNESMDLQQQNNRDNNTPAVLPLNNTSSLSINTTPPEQIPSTPITVKRDGAKRYCQKCKTDKFDRSHHCRACKRCILKMDHHCPWINNCVGFNNYKFFYLFIIYGALFCIYVFATALPPTINVLNEPMGIFNIDFNWLFLLFASGVFGIFLTPFSMFHTRQLFKNRTTIEFYEKSNFKLGRHRHGSASPRGHLDIMRSKYFNPWDLGARSNIEQVLGNNYWSWILPIGSPVGDGCNFPLNSYAYNTLAVDDDDDE
ncbi:unnamed protein product [Cunninghamella blakesleeana]